MEKWRLLTRLQLYLHTVSGSAGLEWAEKWKRGAERRIRKKKQRGAKQLLALPRFHENHEGMSWKRKDDLADTVIAAGTTMV